MAKYYVIKVSYFVWDETKKNGIGREPRYLYTSRDKFRIYVFRPTLKESDVDLKWFETREQAKEYINRKFKAPSKGNIVTIPCFDHIRIEEVESRL